MRPYFICFGCMILLLNKGISENSFHQALPANRLGKVLFGSPSNPGESITCQQ